RVARAALPAVADRDLHVVGAAGADAVAGVAGDQLAARQARIEEQHVAQFNLLGRQRLAAEFFHALGNGAEQGCGGGTQRVTAARGGGGRISGGGSRRSAGHTLGRDRSTGGRSCGGRSSRSRRP